MTSSGKKLTSEKKFFNHYKVFSFFWLERSGGHHFFARRCRTKWDLQNFFVEPVLENMLWVQREANVSSSEIGIFLMDQC